MNSEIKRSFRGQVGWWVDACVIYLTVEQLYINTHQKETILAINTWLINSNNSLPQCHLSPAAPPPSIPPAMVVSPTACVENGWWLEGLRGHEMIWLIANFTTTYKIWTEGLYLCSWQSHIGGPLRHRMEDWRKAAKLQLEKVLEFWQHAPYRP